MRNSVAIDIEEYRKYENNQFVKMIIEKLKDIKKRKKLRSFLTSIGFNTGYNINKIIQRKINKFHMIYQTDDNKNAMVYRHIQFRVITMILPAYGFIEFDYIIQNFYDIVFYEIIQLLYVIQYTFNIKDDIECFKKILSLL